MNKKSPAATGSTQKDRRLLLSGVFVLTFANILVKICGLIYKIPLNNSLGDEMININAAHSIYNILYMISTAGIPVAVSVLVSECRAKGDVLRLKRVHKVSLITLSIVGIFGTIIMILSAGLISQASTGGESYFCILAIAPSLFFIAICSVYRGYFQGFQQMTPTAVSEIIESFGKMAIGLLFIYLSLYHFGQSRLTAAAWAVFAETFGIILGMLFLVLIRSYYFKKNKLTMFGDAIASETVTDKSPVLPRLASIAIPISLSAVMLNVAALVDTQMMWPLLSSYLGDGNLAKEIASDYSTGAVTLYNLPTVLIYPISCSIVPFISAALESGDRRSVRRVTNSALRITAILALPCALGMSALSGPILDLVFSISVFLVSMLSVTNALLQGNHHEKKPMISMGVGLGVKIISDILLTRNFGAIGAPLSTVLFHATVVCFNFYFVIRHTEARPNFISVFFRPFVAALVSAGSAILFYRLLTAYIIGGRIATLLAILGAAIVYALAVFLFRCIVEDDILMLPKGEKIKRLLKSLHLLA